ncbi:MAG TPA: DUF4394 domain-containing protein [Iamia sp.]|nr:DUF4394 domain-containing protein [Iamia sp.]
MTDRVRDRFARRVALVALLVGLVVVGAPAPPARAAAPPVAEAGTGRAQPWDAYAWVRQLVLDLQNDADPDEHVLTEMRFLLTIELARGFGEDIEWLQRRPESRAAVVDDLFEAVLRRTADAASRSFFVGRLERIGRQKVMADLLASAEHRATQGGGTDAGWIDALYRDALGRPADAAGRQYFLQQLDAGRTRGSIASFFTGGAEGRTALVRRLMAELLRRPADAPSIGYYAGRLAAGTSVERVIALIASAPEYRDRAMAPVPPIDVVWLYRGSQIGLASVESRTLDVTGLIEGDDLVAVDIRPATGGLYGVTESGQVVSISPAGVATPVGSPLAGLDPAAGVGLDVDPVADAVVVTAGTAVRRIDPDTGVVAPSVTSAYAADDRHEGAVPQLAGVAFTASARSTTPPSSTTGYAIDVATDTLVTQAADGTVATVGPLHADANPRLALDVAPDAPQAAYAVLTVPRAGRSLWRIDLATGEPRFINGVSDSVIGLAVVGDPAVASVEPAYGITPGATPELHRITTHDATPSATWPVTGITAGTEVVGLDVRPSTGGLYGIGSNGQLYALPVPAGVGPVVATPLGLPLAQFDVEDGVGFEVDPTDDAARVVNGDRSYRVRTTDGVVVGDGTEPGTPGTMEPAFPEEVPQVPVSIRGTASTHGQRGAPAPPAYPAAGSATAFHIELAGGGRLLGEQVGDPLRVFVVGPLFREGEVVDEVVGFDITGGYRHAGYAMLELNGLQAVVAIDLDTGAATPLAILTGAPERVYAAFALA